MRVFLNDDKQDDDNEYENDNEAGVVCKMLDCDTVSQAKSKALDVLYMNTPFSQRPSISEVDLCTWFFVFQNIYYLVNADRTEWFYQKAVAKINFFKMHLRLRKCRGFFLCDHWLKHHMQVKTSDGLSWSHRPATLSFSFKIIPNVSGAIAKPRYFV